MASPKKTTKARTRAKPKRTQPRRIEDRAIDELKCSEHNARVHSEDQIAPSSNRSASRDRVTDHATPKPVELVAKALANSTVAGEIVLDPFCGGGATLMGCERAGRRCRAIELEPAHVDTIVRRWESVTGRQARLVGPGAHTFAGIALSRT